MTWNLDPAHSSLEFSAKHLLMATVKGSFREWSVDADVNENDLAASKAVIRIAARSIDTGNEGRDNHLRSADFLDAENHPEISFATRRIERRGSNGDVRIIGDLSIRGVTREVALNGEIAGPVQDPWGMTRAGLSAEGKLNRMDWGVSFNAPFGTGGLVVSDQVKIAINAELTKSA